MAKRYGTDLSDRAWNCIKDLLPERKKMGRPREVDLREVLNAIFYVDQGGIAWNLMPKDFPPYKTVYGSFRQWRIDGMWQRIHDCVRERVRTRGGRHRQPLAAVVDSQSVATTDVGGPGRGFDGGKCVRGRKRHILVDSCGLLLWVVVTTANLQDKTGARAILDAIKDGLRRLKLMPRCWVVERSFGWLNKHRRLSKDYERLPQTSEAMIRVACIRLMLARLAA